MKRTAALTRLQSRLEDAQRLVEIHGECTGQNRGRRVGYDALNRSAIILAMAAWEGFVEDLLKTAVAQISRHANGPSALSENVREAMIAYMYETHGWGKLNTTTKETIWALTGRGWRKSYRDYTQVRINSLHTPNYENVKKLYSSTIGLADFTCDWGATRWRPEDYRHSPPSRAECLKDRIFDRDNRLIEDIFATGNNRQIDAFRRQLLRAGAAQSLACGANQGLATAYSEIHVNSPVFV